MSEDIIEIREIQYGSADYPEALKLREIILRKPLGLTFKKDFLKGDEDDFHFAAYLNRELIAVLQLKPINYDCVKMRQVAVKGNLQGLGVGQRLVQYSEEFAKGKGFNRIELHARETALRFYMHLGYTMTDPEFYEVGIPHRKMYKELL